MDLMSTGATQYVSTAAAPVPVNMVDAAGGMHLWAFGVLLTMKALGNETGGAYSVFEVDVHPGASVASHVHSREVETWYVLEGELDWEVGGQIYRATVGSFIHLPKFTSHGFTNNSGRQARMVLTCTPAGFENWFLEIGIPVADRNNPGEVPIMTDAEVQRAADLLVEKYGIHFASSPDS